MRRSLLLLMVVVTLAAVSAPVAAQETALAVVTSTALVADVARHVGGPYVEVTALLGPNTDTHSYQPTAQDIALVADADLLLVVGAGYEEFLGGLMEHAGAAEPVVISNGIEIRAFGGHVDGEATDEPILGVLGEDAICGEPEALEEGEDEHTHGACDPHVWMNPRNVMIWTRNIADAFAAADPDHAGQYQANADAYIDELSALDEQLRSLLAEVPSDRRILVSNHAFLGYFADAYGFEAGSTIQAGVTTGAEPHPRELGALIDRLRTLDVPAIFVEVSANTDLASIVAAEAGIEHVVSLYSETLGAAGGGAETYVDFMRYNAEQIRAALGQ